MLKSYLQLYEIYNKKGNNQPCIDFLKPLREDAVLDSAGRLFHSLAPRKEKHFCPFGDLFFGNLISVSVFRRLREEHTEFVGKEITQVLRSQIIELLEDHCFGLFANEFFNGLPAQLCNKWSAWVIKVAICYDPSSTILKFLQLADDCRPSTTPDRTTISKVGLDNTSVKSFQTCHRQKRI